MDISKLVTEMRKKSGLSQYNFGFQYGLGPHAIARYERGERMPRADIFMRMLVDYAPYVLAAQSATSLLPGRALANEKT